MRSHHVHIIGMPSAAPRPWPRRMVMRVTAVMFLRAMFAFDHPVWWGQRCDRSGCRVPRPCRGRPCTSDGSVAAQRRTRKTVRGSGSLGRWSCDWAERDRDIEGRARQARPRDALGRPLPYGAEGVEPVSEEPLPRQEALRTARELVDAGRPSPGSGPAATPHAGGLKAWTRLHQPVGRGTSAPPAPQTPARTSSVLP